METILNFLSLFGRWNEFPSSLKWTWSLFLLTAIASIGLFLYSFFVTVTMPKRSGTEFRTFSRSQRKEAETRFASIKPMTVSVFYSSVAGEKARHVANTIRDFFWEIGWTDTAKVSSIMSEEIQGVVVHGYNHLDPDVQRAVDTITEPFGVINDSQMENLSRRNPPLPNNLTIIVGHLDE